MMNSELINKNVEQIRDQISLYMCVIMEGDMYEESGGLAITDKENDKFYFFLKENGFDFKETFTSEGMTLHIKDNDQQITIKVKNDSELEDISGLFKADAYVLDERFVVGYL